MSSGESYYRLETADGCLIITLLPELNDKQWADIEKVGSEIVDRLSTAQSPRFIVDLTPLSYMGSAMVALIVRLYKSVTGRNGQMVVVNQHELVYEVLKLAGLTKLWTIVDSRDKAFATLGVRRRSAPVDGSPREGGNAILLAGVIGAVGAIIGLALQFSSHVIVPRKYALLIEVAFAALGMVVGTMILVNQSGGRRNIGIALLAICLLVVLGGIVAGPEQSPANHAPAPAGTSSTAPLMAPPTASSTAVPATAAVLNSSNTGGPASAPAAKVVPVPNSPAAATQTDAPDQPKLRKRKDR